MYKKLFENKKAIFFDMDGTIVDTAEHWQRAFNKVVNAVGFIGLEKSAFLRGFNLRDEIKRLADYDKFKYPENPLRPNPVPIDILVNKVNEFFIAEIQNNPPEITPGFFTYLGKIKDRKMPSALVSNSRRQIVDTVLDTIAINSSIFDLIITAEDVKHPKPSPEIYNTAAKKINVKSEQVMVFEDSVRGAESSAKANMDTVIIWPDGLYRDEYPEKAVLFVKDFVNLDIMMDYTLAEYMDKTARDQIANEG